MRTAVFAAAVLILSLRPSLAQSLHTDPDTERANNHYRSGWEAFRAEDWEQAAKEFQQAIAIKPRFKLAFYGLGRSYMGLKRFPEAIKAYEACRGMYEAQASETFRDAQEADQIRQQDLQALRSAINTLSARSPGQQNPTASQNQIRQLRDQMQRIEQKRNEINNNLTIVSEVPAFVFVALGSAYLRANQFPDAERAYKAALDADPKAGEAWNNLAALYLMTGRIDEADHAATMAEKVGFKLMPGLKEDIRKRKSG
jgi:Flp pilus assembly protein TadD, contains TPR repeats